MKTTVLSVIMLLSTFGVNADYSSHHFDPVRLAVGSKEIPNSSFWSSQGAKIQHFIVEDDSFTGGRALQMKFPVDEKFQAFHCRLDAVPSDAAAVEFSIQLVEGESPAYMEFTQKNSAGGDNVFCTELPKLIPGKTLRLRKNFSTLHYTKSYGNNSPDDREFVTGRVTGMNIFVNKNTASSFRLGAVHYIRGEKNTVNRTNCNLMVWDPDFETGNSGFMSMDMKRKAETVKEGFESAYSLRIVSPTTSSLMPDIIRSGKEYCLSFYVKGRPGTRGNVSFFSFHWRRCAETEFSLSSEWRRITLRIPPYDNAHPSHRIIFRTSGAPFLVDRIQLEEGSRASEFVRPQAITLNATTGAPAEIVTTSELPVSLKGAVSFALPPAVPLSVRLYLKNKIVAEEQLPVKESLVHFEFPCSFAETAGYYPCRIEVVDMQGKILARQSVPFVVAKPFVLPGDYYGIMSGAIELEALRRMGASVLRNNIEVWKEREAQGPRPNRPEEIATEPAYGSDFRLLGTLYNLAEIPQWARETNSTSADPEKFAAYLERLLERQKNYITYLEMDNEVDHNFVRQLGISPDEAVRRYGDLLKTAYPIARKYGKKLAVSPCTGITFAEQLFRYAHESFDIFAVHPYVYPRTLSPLGYYCANPESGGFLLRMDNIVRLIRQYGGRHELAVGELGWNLTTDADYTSRAAAIQAAYLARASILMRTYPECLWSVWYTITNNTGESDYGIFRLDNGMRPLPAVAAFAQTAHMFHGMSGGQAKRLTDSEPNYLVEWSLDGERRFALWTTDENAKPLFLSLPGIDAYDVFGKPLDSRNIPYSDFPVFLTVPEQRGDAAAGAIRQELEKCIPVTLHASLASRDEVLLQVHNNGDQYREIDFSINGMPSGKITLKPLADSVFTLPLPGPVPLDRESDYSLKMVNNGTVFFQNIHFQKLNPVVFRNCVRDWKTWDFTSAPEVITLDRRSDIQPPDVVPWKGPADLSAKLFFCYDESAFYLFASVQDDKLEPWGEGRSIYQGDCLQFGIDPDNDARPREHYRNDYEYGSAYGRLPWCWVAPDGGKENAQYEDLVSRTGDRTIYRIRVPWKLLSPLEPVAGKVFGMGIVINDRDNGNAQFRLEFGGGIAAGKKPALFRKMVLLPKK